MAAASHWMLLDAWTPIGGCYFLLDAAFPWAIFFQVKPVALLTKCRDLPKLLSKEKSQILLHMLLEMLCLLMLDRDSTWMCWMLQE
ncbi:hypothetical protein LR48_Vigan10g093800 [Vigna angularis]|uniref:Uncharacterized protein n=1 Tax=Phaseolus angularis TaxID=3914 RepID=A0A0L9VJ26_PHAAN|nr:hypothetical protein LR48_Vigan10g093800 [Vigna angularis]